MDGLKLDFKTIKRKQARLDCEGMSTRRSVFQTGLTGFFIAEKEVSKKNIPGRNILNHTDNKY